MQRHEDLGLTLLIAVDLVLYDRDPAIVSMLFLEPLKDTLAGVTLLMVYRFVSFEDLVDDRNKRLKLRLRSHRFLSMAWWLRIVENLADRPVIEFVLLARLADTHLVHQNIKTNIGPFVHVCQHSFPRDPKHCPNYAAFAANSSLAHKSQVRVKSVALSNRLFQPQTLHFQIGVYNPCVLMMPTKRLSYRVVQDRFHIT